MAGWYFYIVVELIGRAPLNFYKVIYRADDYVTGFLLATNDGFSFTSVRNRELFYAPFPIV